MKIEEIKTLDTLEKYCSFNRLDKKRGRRNRTNSLNYYYISSPVPYPLICAIICSYDMPIGFISIEGEIYSIYRYNMPYISSYTKKVLYHLNKQCNTINMLDFLDIIKKHNIKIVGKMNFLEGLGIKQILRGNTNEC